MISLARLAQLLGGDEMLPGAVERGDALERAVRAGLPFVAVRRLSESARLITAEEVFLGQGRAGQGGGCGRPIPSSTAAFRWRWRRAGCPPRRDHALADRPRDRRMRLRAA